MNRKRRTLLLLFLPLAVLMTVSAVAIYRDYRQQRLNQDLIAALKQGDIAAEVRLLNAGADANARDMGEQPVTFWGVLRDYWQRLRTGKPAKTEFHTPALLVFSISDIRFQDRSLNEKAWIAQTVPLLNHGANINSQDKNRRTVLWWACACNYLELARLLIKRGADINNPESGGENPLEVSITGGHLGLVKALLQAGAKVNSGQGLYLLRYARSQLVAAKETENASNLRTYQEIIRLLKQAGAHE